ncbi:MAG: TonB-dependent receptor plug domain-containing protein, partial [Vicinamibacterales bacterium]
MKPFVRALLSILLCPLLATAARAQNATIEISVQADAAPLSGAEVTVNGVTYETGADGLASISVRPGAVEIIVAHSTFAPARTSLQAQAGQRHSVIVELESVEIEEVVTVSATRTDARLEDLPMRVEVLPREEIEEKMMMTPGDIVMMLNETGGLRVQATSPSLGAASVRIQGMRGRYTRFLSDGLPLFGEVGGLGLLQIPPMDLGQFEVIKGVASALYGSGAMGGVVNLISRRPAAEPAIETLVNRSSRGATDATTFIAGPLASGWSASLLGGGHWQQETDVDDDAWIDLPGYSRAVLRPRLFWDDGAGRTLFATSGFTYENRQGGTRDGFVLPSSGASYVEGLETRRFDGGLVFQTLWHERFVVAVRAAAARQNHDHLFGESLERDRHDTFFGEATIRMSEGRHTLVGGVALERETYRPRDLARFSYTFTVPGVFAQDDVRISDWLTVSASGRV